VNTALLMPMQRDASFGDLLVQVPLAHALKANLGAERVAVIAPHPFVELLAELGVADRVHVIADQNRAAVARCIREEDPRWAITLRGSSLRSSWQLWRHCSRHATTAGWCSFGNRLLLDHCAPRVRDDYYALVLGRVLAPLGATLDLAAAGRAIAAADPTDALEAGRRRLICIPAGKVDAKQWGVENYLELGARLGAETADLVPTAILGPREAELAERFAAAGWQTISAPHPRRLAALCRDAYGVVANDCGPGHLAHLSGAPLVTLFHNAGDHQRRAELIRLWWWRRAHSRAITTAEARPLTELPVAVVLEELRSAIEDPAPRAEARWWR